MVIMMMIAKQLKLLRKNGVTMKSVVRESIEINKRRKIKSTPRVDSSD